MPAFAIKDIQANPFRHISRYPIRREKVAALRESMRTTSFWENIVARPKDGKAEIAYGHHRLVALREEYGPNQKVQLILRKLGDDDMIQIMARENMEEWGTNAAVEHETIRAVVEAFGKGQIELPEPGPAAHKSDTRYAPSFLPGDQRGARASRPYTPTTLAKFIGWVDPSGKPQDKVFNALSALQFIEEGLLKETDFDDLSTKQAQAVIEEARKARSRREAAARVHRLQAEQAEREAREAEERSQEAERKRRLREAEAAEAQDAESRRAALDAAKRLAAQRREAEEMQRRAAAREKEARGKERAAIDEGRRRATAVGRAVSSNLKTGKIGYRGASDVAMRVEGKKADGPPPYIDDIAERLASDLNVIFDPDRDPRVKKLEGLVQYSEYLNDEVRSDLAKTLEIVGNRAFDYARRLSSKRSETRALTTGRR